MTTILELLSIGILLAGSGMVIASVVIALHVRHRLKRMGVRISPSSLVVFVVRKLHKQTKGQ